MKKIAIIIFFSLSLSANSQRDLRLEREISEFVQRIISLHGHVFIDTSYEKLNLKEIRGEKLKEEITEASKFVSSNKMHLRDFNFEHQTTSFGHRFSDPNSFYKTKDQVLRITIYDSIYTNKIDSFYNSISKVPRDSLSENDLLKENLVFRSSYWKRTTQEAHLAQKKLIKLYSIYESSDYFLILYSISYLAGYLHSDYFIELIIK